MSFAGYRWSEEHRRHILEAKARQRLHRPKNPPRRPRDDRYQLTDSTPTLFAAITLWLVDNRTATIEHIAGYFEVHPRRVRRYLMALAQSVFTEFSDRRLVLIDYLGNEMPVPEHFLNGYAGETAIHSVRLVDEGAPR